MIGLTIVPGRNRINFPSWILVIFSGNHSPDTPPGIIRVARIAGDKMTVAVHHRLPRCCTDVISDIISGWLEIFLNDIPAFIDKISHRMFLIVGQGEIVRRMPERHDKQVPFGDRKPVPAGIAVGVSCYNIIPERGTERAAQFFFHFIRLLLHSGKGLLKPVPEKDVPDQFGH